MKGKVKSLALGALAILLTALALSGCCWKGCWQSSACCTGERTCCCEKCKSRTQDASTQTSKHANLNQDGVEHMSNRNNGR